VEAIGRSRNPRAGLTLVEVVFASAFLSVLVFIVYLVLHRSADRVGNESIHLALDERAREVLSQLARDLRDSARETLSSGTPPAPVVTGQAYADLRFGVNSGYDLATRAIRFTQVCRYRFVPDPAELANGADDDGDGLADEGSVEKTDRHGQVTRICDNVAASGLRFVLEGRLITVTLVLAQRDSKGFIVRREAKTSVELRN
jgi:hypothetical protein